MHIFVELPSPIESSIINSANAIMAGIRVQQKSNYTNPIKFAQDTIYEHQASQKQCKQCSF